MSSERIVMKVDGMTCGGCEASIRTALEHLSGVQVLEASHEEGTVEILYESDANSRDDLVGAVEEAGYEVLSV